jgi:SPP1 gp7 family putative phage head morphogenesis protein
VAKAIRFSSAHLSRLRVEAEQVREMRRTLLVAYRADLAAAIKAATRGHGNVWTWQIAARARGGLEAAGMSFGRKLTALVVDSGDAHVLVGAEGFVSRLLGRKVTLPNFRRTLFSFRTDVGAFTGRNLALHTQALSVNGAVLEKTVVQVERDIVAQASKRASNLAERVITTETTRSTSDGALMAADAIGIAMLWDAELDMRTCVQCAALHGRVVRPWDARPPAHPRCRCMLSPEFVFGETGWSKSEVDELAGELNKSSGQSGTSWWVLLAAAIVANRRRKQAEEQPVE